MGLLTKTIFEATTDMLYQRVNAAVVTDAADMLIGNTADGLAGYIDTATGDAAVQSALLLPAANVDKQALTLNLREFIERAISDPKWRSFVQAMDTYVRSYDGGSYDDFAAYVTAVAAQVHPLAAELISGTLGEGALQTSGIGIGAIHPYMNIASFDRVYTGVQGSLVNDTTDAASVTTADVALFAADNTVLVLQSRSRFDKVLLSLSTLATVDVGLVAYYWNGTTWATVALTDLTVGMSVNGGMISWTMPADWVPCNKDMQGIPTYFNAAQTGALYTLILQRTTDIVVTPPVATWLKTIPETVLAADGKLFGLDQPPIALIRVTAANTATTTIIQQPQYERFLPPGTTNNGLKLVAITPFAADVTVTLGYTDQAGNAGSKAQLAWTAAIAAGDEKNIALDTGDTAIRSLVAANCSVVTAATSGIIAVVANAYPRAIAAK